MRRPQQGDPRMRVRGWFAICICVVFSLQIDRREWNCPDAPRERGLSVRSIARLSYPGRSDTEQVPVDHERWA
jgi:hypothetical protein